MERRDFIREALRATALSILGPIWSITYRETHPLLEARKAQKMGIFSEAFDEETVGIIAAVATVRLAGGLLLRIFKASC